MLPKYIAQIVVAGATAIGRALNRAIREELRTGRQAAARQEGSSGSTSENAAHTRKRASANLRHNMTLQEATQILHVNVPLSQEEVEKQFRHLYSCNEKTKGGSFYLQAKIESAKERIDEELKLHQPKSDDNSQEQTNKNEQSPDKKPP